MNELPSPQPLHLVVDVEESGILIEARSTAGNITFGTNAITGVVDVAEFDGSLLTAPPPRAEMVVDLRSLRSGNALYDAELGRRLDVRRFPEAVISLVSSDSVGDRYRVTGEVALHGQTRVISGSVTARRVSDGWILSGQQLFDIRDFEISVPSVLMLRIFPDVMIFLTVKLAQASTPSPR